jgi:GTP-binding protein
MKKKPNPIPEIVATSYLPDQIPEMRGATALFLGRSNAGKSTLLNTIFKKELARVSKSPGKTRSVNFYRWGPRLTLVDVPGFGFAQRSREERDGWQRLMAGFFDRLPEFALSFLLMDCKRELEVEEFGLIEALHERGVSCHLLLTKCDHLNQAEREGRRRGLEAQFAVPGREIPLTWSFVSAKTGEGIDALRRRLLDYAKEIPISAQNHDPQRSRRGAGH